MSGRPFNHYINKLLVVNARLVEGATAVDVDRVSVSISQWRLYLILLSHKDAEFSVSAYFRSCEQIPAVD
jgi:hypothetical protein